MKPIKYFKPWVVFALIALFGGMLVGAIAGAVIGVILGAAGVSLKTIPIITGGVGFLLGLPVSFLSYRWSVKKYIVEPLLAEVGLGSPPPPME